MRNHMTILATGVLLSFTAHALAAEQIPWTKEAAQAAIAEGKKLSKDFPWKTVPKKEGKATLIATAEIQVGTAIDFGLTLPPGAGVVSFALYAKNGVAVTGNAAEWKACQTSENYLCPGVPGSYWGYGPHVSDAGTTYQIRFVPNGGAGGIRARLVLTYLLP